VTLALFLLPDLGSGVQLILTGSEAHHAATVKRLAVGESVLLSDGRGGLARARAASVGRDRVVFDVLGRTAHPLPEPRFVVVQALPKGERADLAVEALTELGVDEILPWSATRSISQWRGPDRIERGLAKWRRTALEAAKQSRRPWIPTVAELASTAQAVQRVAAAAAAYLLHEDADVALVAQRQPSAGEIVLIIGPEGGISTEESDAFCAAGAIPVRLGDQVLRTSTAGAAALAVLSVATGRWGATDTVAP
jgi:16S rRNA (uracil1498-N3)-methyltransferase